MHQCAWFSSSEIPRGCPDPVGSDRRRKGIGSYHHADGCGLDTGDMLLRTVVPLDEKETGGSLFDKLSKAGAGLLLETLDALEKGTVTPKKQGESPTAYAKMLTKDMGAIDWNRPAEELERLIRGLNPWPSATQS